MNWTKLLYSAVAAAIIFLLFELFGGLVSPHVVYAVLGLGAGVAVYFFIATWEVKAAAAKVGVKL